MTRCVRHGDHYTGILYVGLGDQYDYDRGFVCEQGEHFARQYVPLRLKRSSSVVAGLLWDQIRHAVMFYLGLCSRLVAGSGLILHRNYAQEPRCWHELIPGDERRRRL